MMMVMMTLAASALQRRRQFVEADRTVAVLVELAEDVVGLREVGSAGAKCIFEFRFTDLAVTVGIELREQVFQRVGLAGRCRCGCGGGRLALGASQGGGCGPRKTAATTGPRN